MAPFGAIAVTSTASADDDDRCSDCLEPEVLADDGRHKIFSLVINGDVIFYIEDTIEQSLGYFEDDQIDSLKSSVSDYNFDSSTVTDVLNDNNIDYLGIVDYAFTFNDEFESCPIPGLEHYVIGAGFVFEDDLHTFETAVLGGALCHWIPKSHLITVLLSMACAGFAYIAQDVAAGNYVSFGVWDDHRNNIPGIRAAIYPDIVGPHPPGIVEALDPFRFRWVAGHTMQDLM